MKNIFDWLQFVCLSFGQLYHTGNDSLVNCTTADSCPRFYLQSTYMELSKLPTWPGVSPGVGLWKQGLLMLQIMPWIQGKVPADGNALFGKWPTSEGTEKQTQKVQYQEISPRYETMKILWPWPETQSTGTGLNNNPSPSWQTKPVFCTSDIKL